MRSNSLLVPVRPGERGAKRLVRGAAIALLLVAACSRTAPAPTTTTGSATPAAATGPRVVFPDGTVIRVEIAADDPTREQGLMFRDQLAADHGMIFIFAQNGVYPFWMKNTIIPLDMIWIDDQHRVNYVASDALPCKADPCPNYGSMTIPSRYVLETAAGVAKKHNVAAGSLLRFEELGNVIVR
ncbi:MAG TPA: DUF192 domain-containing protein [Thermoanaerobaculia bacterium]